MTITGRADTCKLTDAMHFVLWACQLKATCGMWLQVPHSASFNFIRKSCPQYLINVHYYTFTVCTFKNKSCARAVSKIPSNIWMDIAIENIINCGNTSMTLRLEKQICQVLTASVYVHKMVWENHGCMPISGNPAHTPELQ